MREDEDGDWVHYEDYEDEVNALKSDNKRLRNALSLITSFIPIGWAMPLGFYNVVAQAKDALKMEEVK